MAPHSIDIAERPHFAVEETSSTNGLGLDPVIPKDEQLPKLRTIFPPLEIEDQPIDTITPLKVIVVGAGIAGITAGILLPRKVPGIDLTILERHSDVVCCISYSEIIADIKREACGMLMCILVFDVIFPQMSIKVPLLLPLPGKTIMAVELRFRLTGGHS